MTDTFIREDLKTFYVVLTKHIVGVVGSSIPTTKVKKNAILD